MTVRRWGRVALLALVVTVSGQMAAQAPAPTRTRLPAIQEADLKAWLTYLASDALGGRQVFTEGYGIAAQFVAERLREWGVKPLGDHGTYFQIVKLQSYNVARHSSVTIEANGQRQIFRDGDHVAFPAIGGGRQQLTFDSVLVTSSPSSLDGPHPDALVVFIEPGVRLIRLDDAEDAAMGGATIELRAELPSTPETRGGRGAPDIAPTTQRVDAVAPPQLTADEAFVSALLATAPGGLAAIRDRLARGPDRALTVPAKVTIQVDNVYEPVTTRLTRNVVGMIEGRDRELKQTYVMFGAHLDHVGYASSDRDLPGEVNTPIAEDRIWNGADDDGTGVTAELAIAKAFATGPKPRRSVVFIWHAGEENDLYGSKYNADFPVVPLDKVQCLLNIDMIGRNRDDDPARASTVFVIGDDRISTDLHNLIVETNDNQPAPLTLDYEYNDPSDLNSFYTRSDHFSYAVKGIPIAFFFTGTHRDYHANTDSVDKILFAKQARIAQLVYEAGYSVADSEGTLRRDNKGPRMGAGASGLLK